MVTAYATRLIERRARRLPLIEAIMGVSLLGVVEESRETWAKRRVAVAEGSQAARRGRAGGEKGKARDETTATLTATRYTMDMDMDMDMARWRPSAR